MCPACEQDGPHTLLGALGRRLWLRCRYCGIDFNVPNEELSND